MKIARVALAAATALLLGGCYHSVAIGISVEDDRSGVLSVKRVSDTADSGMEWCSFMTSLDVLGDGEDPVETLLSPLGEPVTLSSDYAGGCSADTYLKWDAESYDTAAAAAEDAGLPVVPLFGDGRWTFEIPGDAMERAIEMAGSDGELAEGTIVSLSVSLPGLPDGTNADVVTAAGSPRYEGDSEDHGQSTFQWDLRNTAGLGTLYAHTISDFAPESEQPAVTAVSEAPEVPVTVVNNTGGAGVTADEPPGSGTSVALLIAAAVLIAAAAGGAVLILRGPKRGEEEDSSS